MNKQQKAIWRNKILQRLDRDSRRHLNCVRIGRNESWKHLMGKLENTVKSLFVIFDDFITEVYDKTRKHRADVLLFTYPDPTIIEIACNETKKSIERKKKFWENQGFEFKEVRV